ncbi:unnamed protein product, partial [Amaranthus hypochondriacus]
MAEVKQVSGTGSFSHSMKKKPPSFSSNGVSSSFKHLYEDVFVGPLSNKVKSSNIFMEDDYAEIFGSSKSSEGLWNLSYSSVPILELPKELGIGSRGGSMDYGGVFGGFDFDGGSSSFGLPDGEELFDQLKKKAKTSVENNLPRGHVRTTGATSPENSSQSYERQSAINGSCQTSDNTRHLEAADHDLMVNATNSHRKASHVRSYSLQGAGGTQNAQSSQTPVTKDDMPDKNSIFEKQQGKHSRHTSLDLGAKKQNSNCDAGLQNIFGLSGSNSVDTSHDACQLNKAATDGLSQSFDNTKHSDHESNEVGIETSGGEIHSSDGHQTHESNISAHELGPTQERLSSKTYVLDDETQPDIQVNLSKEQTEHPLNTGLDLGSKQNDECEAVFSKECGLSEPISVDASHESSEASCVAGTSYVVKDDAETSVGCDDIKKKARHSKVTSIDLGDYKHSCVRDDGLKRKPRLGGSYSFDASHDPCSARVKVQSSMMYPSSSLPRFFPVENSYKVSENSSFKGSQQNRDKGSEGSPPDIAEELDVNSAAAVSAAALQRAIEEAEMRIRLAKSFLEREGQGSNMRFKDTLKVKVAKKNGIVNEINKLKKHKIQEYFQGVDSELQRCSLLERKHVVVAAQGTPISEDRKKSVENPKLTDGENAKVSNSVRGEEKCEVGEWEAAKHFNQLFSGVKNKLASFMSWQTETEKKEDPKEIGATMKRQQQPEGIEHDLKHQQGFMIKKTAQNPDTGKSAGEVMYGENKIQIASDVVETGKNGVIRSFNVKNDKARSEENFILDTAESSSKNFQFFAFRNQRLSDLSDSDVEEKGPLESQESVIMNGQESVINEVHIEPLPNHHEEATQQDIDEAWQEEVDVARLEETDDAKREEADARQEETDDAKWEEADVARQEETDEAKQEEIDEIFVTEHCKTQDIYRTRDIDYSNEENDMTFEDCCSLDGHEKSSEEDMQGEMSRKDDICVMNGENVEMVHPMGGHDTKELIHENIEYDGMSKESHLGYIN